MSLNTELERGRSTRAMGWFAGFVLAAAALLASPSMALLSSPSQGCQDGGPPPNTKFNEELGVGSNNIVGPTMLGEMLDYIRENVSEALADEMEAALIGPNACVVVVALWHREGLADATTIGVRIRGRPRWFSAITLVHEYEHWKRARAASILTGDPETGDPETADDNPCGKCNHVMMGVASAGLLADVCENGSMSAADRKLACDTIRSAIDDFVAMLVECKDAGCPECCGFSYIPDAGELFSVPECCGSQ